MTPTVFTVAVVCLLIGAAIGLFIGAVLAGSRVHELQAELREAREAACTERALRRLGATVPDLDDSRITYQSLRGKHAEARAKLAQLTAARHGEEFT